MSDYPNAHPSPLHTRLRPPRGQPVQRRPRPTMPAEDAIWLNGRPFCAVCNEPLAPASEYRPPSVPACPVRWGCGVRPPFAYYGGHKTLDGRPHRRPAP